MIDPQGKYRELPVGYVLVLEHGRLPSTDIYLRPRLEAPGMPPAEVLDMSSVAPGITSIPPPPLGTGIFIVVCRYISTPWLRWLRTRRGQIAGLAFFADDDLPAMMHDRGLPARYRLKVWRLYGRQVRRLSALASELWVSSPALAARYAAASPRTIAPLDPIRPYALGRRFVRYFYHGTATHRAEIEWLRDVVAMVQARNPQTAFELFGDRSVRDLYRHIERVTVLHPMDWPDYAVRNAMTPQDIGLAPLLPGSVNAGRSHSRFFDIVHTGAAGLYSNRPPYAGFVRGGEDGLLLPDDKIAWARAILALAEDEPGRRRLAAAARQRTPVFDDALAFLAPRGRIELEAAE